MLNATLAEILGLAVVIIAVLVIMIITDPELRARRRHRARVNRAFAREQAEHITQYETREAMRRRNGGTR